MGGEESLFLMDLENPSLLENHNFGEIPHKDSPVRFRKEGPHSKGSLGEGGGQGTWQCGESSGLGSASIVGLGKRVFFHGEE